MTDSRLEDYKAAILRRDEIIRSQNERIVKIEDELRQFQKIFGTLKDMLTTHGYIKEDTAQ